MKVTLLLSSGERVVHEDDIKQVTMSWKFDGGEYDDDGTLGITFGTDGKSDEAGVIMITDSNGNPLPDDIEYPEGLEELDGAWITGKGGLN